MNTKNSKVGSTVKSITESTPISIALMGTLLVAVGSGAYVTGVKITEVNIRQDHTEQRVEDTEKRIDAHSELFKKLTEIAADNKRRLEFLERAK